MDHQQEVKVADRSVPVPVTSKGKTRRVIFFLADLYNYARVVRPRMTEFGVVIQVGRSKSTGASHVPIPRCGAPASEIFWDPMYAQMV